MRQVITTDGGSPHVKGCNYVSFVAFLILSDVNPRRCVRGHVIQARAGMTPGWTAHPGVMPAVPVG